MKAYAQKQPRRATCEPRQRAATLRRVRRSERHGIRHRARLALLVALLTGCATAPRVAPEGRAIAIHAGEPAAIDGVLLPVGLAAHLAQAEVCCSECLVALDRQGEAVEPWVLIVVGVVAAGAGAAGGYAAASR